MANGDAIELPHRELGCATVPWEELLELPAPTARNQWNAVLGNAVLPEQVAVLSASGVQRPAPGGRARGISGPSPTGAECRAQLKQLKQP